MGTRIAEAADGDVDTFAGFLRDAWEAYGPGAPGFAGATDEIIADLTRPEVLARRIAAPDGAVVLARDGNRVVGFASLRRLDPDTAELDGIVVLPSWAGAGLGTELVRHVVERSREHGHRSMVVHTETTNTAARGFYEARGFEVTGTAVIDVGGAPVEVWTMTLDLETSTTGAPTPARE